MSVMRALDPPETVYTRDGKRRVTHEAYSYYITPYKNPPVKLEVVKGFIDKNGQFLAVPGTAKALDITPTEFRELISPTPQGKPAGDFRLSDVLKMLNRRTEPPKTPAADPAAAPASTPADGAAPAEAAATAPSPASAPPAAEAPAQPVAAAPAPAAPDAA